MCKRFVPVQVRCSKYPFIINQFKMVSMHMEKP